MKSPTGKGVPRTLKAMEEKSGLPTIATINGVSRSLVRAVTTPPKAAPITTPTAKSTTFPRRMNCLNPLSIKDLLKAVARVPLAQTIVNRELGRGMWRLRGGANLDFLTRQVPWKSGASAPRESRSPHNAGLKGPLFTVLHAAYSLWDEGVLAVRSAWA